MPWVIQGAHWDAGRVSDRDEPDDGLGRCALCGDPLGDGRVLLVRHRGEHRIADAFCRLDHLLDWAKAGGRYGRLGRRRPAVERSRRSAASERARAPRRRADEERRAPVGGLDDRAGAPLPIARPTTSAVIGHV